MTLNVLIDLSDGKTVDAEEVVNRAYDWSRERLILSAKGSVAFVASAIISTAVTVLKAQVHLALWQTVILAIVLGVIVIIPFLSRA